MIPRTLVPKGARPPEGEIVSTRRRPSSLDERTLVPSSLPIVPLNGHSTIPSNLPLEAIATRTVVPRDIDIEAVQRPDESNLPPQPTDMDERITVPQSPAAAPLEVPDVLPAVSEDLVEPDIIQTGEVTFLPAKRVQKATLGEIIVLSGSLLLNLLFIVAIYEVLTYRPRSREVDEISRKNMEVLLPPGALDSLKPSTPKPARPPVKVDPREIRKAAPAPPTPQPVTPPPPQPKRELPTTPTPQPTAVQPTPPPQGNKGELPKTPEKLENPDMPVPQKGLILPQQGTAGDLIRQAERGTRPNAPTPMGGGGPVGSYSRGGGGRGSAGMGPVEILSDTQGVDFNDYLHRIYYIVKGNWFAVMPSSVQLGDNGEVSLVFKIYPNGSVVQSDPTLVYGSGKEPLDRAAVSSIRASNPFPPLPNQFHGPYLELRYTYCYNEQTCPAGR
jgi:TonB family protein